MKSWVRLLVGIGALGVLLSWAFANLTQQRSDEARRDQVQVTSNHVASEAADRVGAAVNNTAALGRASERILLTVDGFEALWASAFEHFGGDSSAFVLAAVDPTEADTFVEDMRTFIPDYEINFRPPETPTTHVLVINGAPDAGAFVGFDLAWSPSIADLMLSLQPNGIWIDGFDSRKAEPEPGDMRVFRAHPIIGPDGNERQGWTVTFVDLHAILRPLVTEFGDNLGAEFTTNLTNEAGTFGVERSDHDFVATSTVSIDVQDGGRLDNFDLTVTTWSDGSHIPLTSGRLAFLIGLAVTAAVVALSAVGLVITSLVARADRSAEAARSDALTGLPNRRWLLEHLPTTDPCALLFCDLDRFKMINDSAGHAVGDELLIAVAERLTQIVGSEGTTCRYGGDEFIVVCPGDDDPKAIGQRVAHRIVEDFDAPFEISTGAVRMTISIGVATRTDGSASVEELIRGADVALGDCKKRRSRGGIVLYDESFKDAERDRLHLETEIQIALDEGDFVLHYQPIVDVNGNAQSVEALVRWVRNDTLVSPDAFLPVIADIHRMDDLGRIVLSQALRTFGLAFAPNEEEGGMRLHVNVDATQLEDPAFAATVALLLEDNRVDPRQLVLELTEGEWVESMDRIAPVLDDLTDLGVGLSIDDFGSGYSSLERLLAIRGLDEIKIDASLVRAAADPRTAGFLAGLIDGIANLGVRIVAEGVETADDFQRMRDLGISRFQGYLFARPNPSNEVGFATRDTELTAPLSAG